MSAFGGKADIGPTFRNICFWCCGRAPASAASKCYRLVASKLERFKEVRPGNNDGVW